MDAGSEIGDTVARDAKGLFGWLMRSPTARTWFKGHFGMAHDRDGNPCPVGTNMLEGTKGFPYITFPDEHSAAVTAAIARNLGIEEVTYQAVPLEGDDGAIVYEVVLGIKNNARGQKLCSELEEALKNTPGLGLADSFSNMPGWMQEMALESMQEAGVDTKELLEQIGARDLFAYEMRAAQDGASLGAASEEQAEALSAGLQFTDRKNNMRMAAAMVSLSEDRELFITAPLASEDDAHALAKQLNARVPNGAGGEPLATAKKIKGAWHVQMTAGSEDAFLHRAMMLRALASLGARMEYARLLMRSQQARIVLDQEAVKRTLAARASELAATEARYALEDERFAWARDVENLEAAAGTSLENFLISKEDTLAWQQSIDDIMILEGALMADGDDRFSVGRDASPLKEWKVPGTDETTYLTSEAIKSFGQAEGELAFVLNGECSLEQAQSILRGLGVDAPNDWSLKQCQQVTSKVLIPNLQTEAKAASLIQSQGVLSLDNAPKWLSKHACDALRSGSAEAIETVKSEARLVALAGGDANQMLIEELANLNAQRGTSHFIRPEHRASLNRLAAAGQREQLVEALEKAVIPASGVKEAHASSVNGLREKIFESAQDAMLGKSVSLNENTIQFNLTLKDGAKIADVTEALKGAGLGSSDFEVIPASKDSPAFVSFVGRKNTAAGLAAFGEAAEGTFGNVTEAKEFASGRVPRSMKTAALTDEVGRRVDSFDRFKAVVDKLGEKANPVASIMSSFAQTINNAANMAKVAPSTEPNAKDAPEASL